MLIIELTYLNIILAVKLRNQSIYFANNFQCTYLVLVSYPYLHFSTIIN